MGRSVRTDGSQILNPGFMREQITWQARKTVGQNSFGEDITEYVDVLSCKAQVEQVAGSDTAAAGQYFAEYKYQITQHYSKGLDPTMRIAWFVDGEVLYLNVLDLQGAPGYRQYQYIIASLVLHRLQAPATS